MSDLMLKAATKAKLHFDTWTRTRTTNDRGQTAVEYLGIIVVVVAIVAVVAGAHGARVEIGDSPLGGARFVVRFSGRSGRDS